MKPVLHTAGLPSGLQARAETSRSGAPRLGLGALLCVLGCSAVLVGCGGSGAGPPAPGPSYRVPNRTGVHPDEVASHLHLSAADCNALAGMLRRQIRRHVRTVAEPSPPLSYCRFAGRGVHVLVNLDAAYGARQRYSNRMVEQVQFGAPDPARLPHPVAGVGDRSPGEHYASWIPAYGTLFAVRGNRWLTVSYSVTGEPRARRRAQAAVLARRAFRLSAR